MPEYRAYIIGRDGHFYRAVNLDCADDADASPAGGRVTGSGFNARKIPELLCVPFTP
jgi:hypothetical protein